MVTKMTSTLTKEQVNGTHQDRPTPSVALPVPLRIVLVLVGGQQRHAIEYDTPVRNLDRSITIVPRRLAVDDPCEGGSEPLGFYIEKLITELRIEQAKHDGMLAQIDQLIVDNRLKDGEIVKLNNQLVESRRQNGKKS
jgi:hypothetical protein